jgi:hypothetical protein
VGFFNSLNNKTILNLAEYVIRKVAHPEETLQRRGEVQNFFIFAERLFGIYLSLRPEIDFERSGNREVPNRKIVTT